MSREGQGFLTVACNSNTTDYLSMAYRLAESIHDTQKVKAVSVITDVKNIDPKYTRMFDKIIQVDANGFWGETHVWSASPYKQTFKIEADMILPSSIDHWWAICDQKDVVLTDRVYTYWHEVITNRSFRKVFDENNLPDIYSGIYYFRYSKESREFFNIVNHVFNNWNYFRDTQLKNCRYQDPVTDEVFAIAARIYGIERCTIDNTIPSFVHMKNTLQDIPSNDRWYNYVYYEASQQAIGHFKQTLPIHYWDKNFNG
jgi:hypothetical protein